MGAENPGDRKEKKKSGARRRYLLECKKQEMEKVMNKKLNPRRRPATAADVKKAKDKALVGAVHLAMTIFFTALLDKHGATAEDLQNLWKEIEELSDSIAGGYVSAADLRRVLRDEYDIRIGG